MVIKKEEFIKKYVKALREGNAAVFAGDFLIARIFYYGAVENLNEAVSILSKTVEYMCIGEIEQDLCRYQEDISEKKYFENSFKPIIGIFCCAYYELYRYCFLGTLEKNSISSWYALYSSF